MNEAEILLMISKANGYKAERVSECEHRLSVAQRAVKDEEDRLEAWSNMIPFEVAKEIAKEIADRDQREREERDDRIYEARLQSSHAFALKEAYEKHKGMLTPEASSKSTLLGVAGLLIGGIFVMYISVVHLAIENEFALLIICAVGAACGMCAGFVFFDLNFVVDDSLERSIASRLTGRDIVRRTYFKSSKD